MKSNKLVKVFALLVIVTHFLSCKKEIATPDNTCETTFYYDNKDKIYLQKSSTTIFVGFKDYLAYEEATSILNKYSYLQRLEKKNYSRVDKKQLSLEIKGYRTCNEVKQILRILKEDENITFANQYLYQLNSKVAEDGLAFDDEFIVYLHKPEDVGLLKDFAGKYNIAIPAYDPNQQQFLLKVDKWADKDAMEMANIFHESGLFSFSSANFYATPKRP